MTWHIDPKTAETDSPLVLDSDGRSVAFVRGGAEAPKRAALIATAPDLLEALRNAATQIEDAINGYPEKERHEPPAKTLARALDALKKAGGAR